MSALVKLRGVSKSFIRGKEELQVLDDIDLSIEEGDFFALMGPSGSGKTTLLNLIGGLDVPTAGYVQVGDTRLDELSAKALAKWRSEHVGFIFQFYNLLPVLTAQRNVELPLLLTRLGRAQRKANASTALGNFGSRARALR
jgi:putative ABC transport system ATP-binding protein